MKIKITTFFSVSFNLHYANSNTTKKVLVQTQYNHTKIKDKQTNREFQETEDQPVRISSRRAVKESSFEERYNKCERRLFNNVENGISNIQAALKKADT